MSIWRLVTREILHRKLGFALGVVSVAVAVGCLVGALTALDAHDARTEELLAETEAGAEERMRAVEDKYRKITKGLGFNVLILPKKQDLADVYADGYVSEYMPEEYVEKLANSGVLTVRHLLPLLQEKLMWAEYKRRIILIGTRGEVPMAHLEIKEPILVTVPPATMVMGYRLHKDIGLSVGSEVALLGRKFTVTKCKPERGNKDDITVWINLAEAQELLDRKGRINGILALQCYCPTPQLAAIREEIARVLPETQVIEFAGKTLVRAEARREAGIIAKQEVAAQKAERAELRRRREAFANVLVPLVVAGCVIWIGFLALANVRERRGEIGILRAIGLRSGQVFFIFVSKAVFMGLLGAFLGYLIGYLVGGTGPGTILEPALPVLVLLFAPLLAGVAALVPAVLAARQDPAVALTER